MPVPFSNPERIFLSRWASLQRKMKVNNCCFQVYIVDFKNRILHGIEVQKRNKPSYIKKSNNVRILNAFKNPSQDLTHIFFLIRSLFSVLDVCSVSVINHLLDLFYMTFSEFVFCIFTAMSVLKEKCRYLLLGHQMILNIYHFKSNVYVFITTCLYYAS